jgi:hypothetical protein
MSLKTTLMFIRFCVAFLAFVSYIVRLINLLQYANSMRSKTKLSTISLVRTINCFARLKKQFLRIFISRLLFRFAINIFSLICFRLFNKYFYARAKAKKFIVIT